MPDKKMINVRLNPQVWARAKASASERGTTLERWVTEALEAHIARQGRGGATGGGAAAAQDSDLAFRVTALEQAVDHLAAQISSLVPGGVAAVIGGSGRPSGAPNGANAA